MWRLRVPIRDGALVALIAIGLCGCGGSDGPQPVQAGGVVTYRGKPLPNAEVVFAPENQGRVASATTDENGRFRLGTFAPGDGALVGKHRVAAVEQQIGPRRRGEHSLFFDPFSRQQPSIDRRRNPARRGDRGQDQPAADDFFLAAGSPPLVELKGPRFGGARGLHRHVDAVWAPFGAVAG